MAGFFVVKADGTRTGSTGSASETVTSKDLLTVWSDTAPNNALCWSVAEAQNAMRAVIEGGLDGDVLIFEDGTSLSAQITSGNRGADRIFSIDNETDSGLLTNTGTTQPLFAINDNGSGAGTGAHDVSLVGNFIQTNDITANGSAISSNSQLARPIRYLGGTFGPMNFNRGTAAATGALFQSTVVGTTFEVKNSTIPSLTFATGSGGVSSAAIYTDENGVIDLDTVTITDLVVTQEGTGACTGFLLGNEASVVDNLTATGAAFNYGSANGTLRGMLSLTGQDSTYTINNPVFTNIAMDGNDLISASQAWGVNMIYNTSTDAAANTTVTINGGRSTGCTKIGNDVAAGSGNSAGGAGLSINNDSTGVFAAKVILIGHDVDDCHGGYGMGGYGTAGGHVEVYSATISNLTDGGQLAFEHKAPNGLAVYKGGSGDAVWQDLTITNVNVNPVPAQDAGQAIYSHNNATTGTARDCTTDLLRVNVSGTTDTSTSPVAIFTNVSSDLHTVTITDSIFDNTGDNEIQLKASGATAVLDVTITDTQIKGYDGLAVTGTYTTPQDFGGLTLDITGSATINLTVVNVTDILGAPTLTLPYPIGTNNGPMFSISTSNSLSTIEAAGFFTGNAGYASLLKTNDVLIVNASDGVKMYTVTVDKQQRTIALSTGLVIT